MCVCRAIRQNLKIETPTPVYHRSSFSTNETAFFFWLFYFFWQRNYIDRNVMAEKRGFNENYFSWNRGSTMRHLHSLAHSGEMARIIICDHRQQQRQWIELKIPESSVIVFYVLALLLQSQHYEKNDQIRSRMLTNMRA